MPRDFARYAKVGEVDAESSQNPPDLENLFLHRWMRYCSVQTVALKWLIFKQKKGCTTISLGLNYCSMGSSQPPSRETVPLRKVGKGTLAASCKDKVDFLCLEEQVFLVGGSGHVLPVNVRAGGEHGWR
jgi:hypothetical protein